MSNEPFIIDNDGNLPNLSDGENFQFSTTNLWPQDDGVPALLKSIDEKLSQILEIIKKNGKA